MIHREVIPVDRAAVSGVADVADLCPHIDRAGRGGAVHFEGLPLVEREWRHGAVMRAIHGEKHIPCAACGIHEQELADAVTGFLSAVTVWSAQRIALPIQAVAGESPVLSRAGREALISTRGILIGLKRAVGLHGVRPTVGRKSSGVGVGGGAVRIIKLHPAGGVYVGIGSGTPKMRLQSRHQLFPQVYRLVNEYVSRKVDFRGCHHCELGLETYVKRIVERLITAIEPDDEKGEPPLLPILNRYKPIGSTSGVNFKTIKACWPTVRSHINQVVADTASWEQSAAFRLERAKLVYAKNDHMEFTIPYEYFGVNHAYVPDFLVRLEAGRTLVLEIKGYEDDQDLAKHQAAKRWVSAVNNWGQLGKWIFHVCKDPQMLGKELEWLKVTRQS